MIREATPSDCANLAALSLSVWFDTYSFEGIRTENSDFALSLFNQDYFLSVLTKKEYKLLVWIDDIYLRGYVLVNLESWYKESDYGFEIEKLYVHTPFQGRGIGRDLLCEVKARYGSRFWLYTWVKNKSIGFYKKFGFKDVGQYDFTLGNDVIENRVLAYGQ